MFDDKPMSFCYKCSVDKYHYRGFDHKMLLSHAHEATCSRLMYLIERSKYLRNVADGCPGCGVVARGYVLILVTLLFKLEMLK